MKRIIYLLSLLVVWQLSLSAAEEPLNTDIMGSLSSDEQSLVSSGDVVVRKIPETQRDGFTYEVVGEMQTSVDVLLDVLMDYEKYGEFMPNVSRVEIFQETGLTSRINFHLEVPMGLSRRHRIEIVLSHPHDDSALLKWDLVEWPGLKPSETIKDSKGYWFIKEISPSKVVVLYHVYNDPGEIPFGMKWLVDPITSSSIPAAFKNTRERAEKAYQSKF